MGVTSTGYEERLQHARQLLDAGWSYEQAARTAHMCRSRLMRDAPGYHRFRHESLTPQQYSRAEQLLEDGCSIREAARSVGATHSRVRRAFPGRGWSVEQTTEYRRMLRELDPDDHQRDYIKGGPDEWSRAERAAKFGHRAKTPRVFLADITATPAFGSSRSSLPSGDTCDGGEALSASPATDGEVL